MLRTDLAVEACAGFENIAGVVSQTKIEHDITVKYTDISSETAAQKVGKPCGKYITIYLGNIAEGLLNEKRAVDIIVRELVSLIGSPKSTLVIGVGNTDITPDALGPKTADGILATRHLLGDFAKKIGLDDLKSVSVLSPGVLGRTGIESAEVIKAVCGEIKPDTIIAVDALAAADIKRLGTTIQINNVGISPGSGVGNRRRELTAKTVGANVIAIGMPTVADSSVLGGEGGFFITPREIDLLISRASELLSQSINFALQPKIDREIILSLV